MNTLLMIVEYSFDIKSVTGVTLLLYSGIGFVLVYICFIIIVSKI